MKLQNLFAILSLFSYIRAENPEEVTQRRASFIFVDNQTEYRWEPNDTSKSGVEEYISDVINIMEGDIFVDENLRLYSKRKAVFENKRWKNKTIPWKFNTDERQFELASSYTLVKKAISILENNSCLHFPIWTKERAKELGSIYLDVGKGSGCGSNVGYRKYRIRKLLLSETTCMKVGIVIHEICHAIGFYHEHARRDRDNYVIVNYENVKESRKENFKIHFPTYNYVQYDYQSIMQYGPYAYSKNWKNTIVPKDEHLMFLLGQRNKLSFYDTKTINLFYECNDLCKLPLRSCKHDGYIDENCTCRCPSGLGDDCSSIENQTECGGISLLNFKYPSTQIYFNSTLNNTGNATKCVWLIESPSLTRMKISIENLNIKNEHYRCVQWLEMRYNLIGQDGPRFCGKSPKLNHLFNTTTNVAMFILESSDNLDNIAFAVNVSILTEYNADINCTFELGNNFCVFNQIGGFDKWFISSDVKGVKGIRGHRNSEKYIYLKPTIPPGNIDGVLESRMIPGGYKCITIHYIINVEPDAYYHLNVILSSTENTEPIILKESNDNWQNYKFSVFSANDFKMTIRGMMINAKNGYIALDDISLTNGLCPGETETIMMTKGGGQFLQPSPSFVPKKFDSECLYRQDFFRSYTAHD